MNKIYFTTGGEIIMDDFKNLPQGYFISNNGNWYYSDGIYNYSRIRDRIFINKMYSVFYYLDIYKKEVCQYSNSPGNMTPILLNKHQVDKIYKFMCIIKNRMCDKVYKESFRSEIHLLTEIIKWNVFDKER